MQRIMTFSIEDIAIDRKAVAKKINKACDHHPYHYKVNGLCQVEDKVYFILLPVEDESLKKEYVLAPIDDVSPDGFTAELETRWESGFNTVGIISFGDNFFMNLYEKEPEA